MVIYSVTPLSGARKFTPLVFCQFYHAVDFPCPCVMVPAASKWMETALRHQQERSQLLRLLWAWLLPANISWIDVSMLMWRVPSSLNQCISGAAGIEMAWPGGCPEEQFFATFGKRNHHTAPHAHQIQTPLQPRHCSGMCSVIGYIYATKANKMKFVDVKIRGVWISPIG